MDPKTIRRALDADEGGAAGLGGEALGRSAAACRAAASVGGGATWSRIPLRRRNLVPDVEIHPAEIVCPLAWSPDA
jgi:hypothetical protein